MKLSCFLITFMFFNFTQASECKKILLNTLNSAKNRVVQNLEKDSPCYNAALIGRLYGPPGCFPPEALTLKNILSPYLKIAEAACTDVCENEGFGEACRNTTSFETLRQNGIDGLVQMIQGSHFN